MDAEATIVNPGALSQSASSDLASRVQSLEDQLTQLNSANQDLGSDSSDLQVSVNEIARAVQLNTIQPNVAIIPKPTPVSSSSSSGTEVLLASASTLISAAPLTAATWATVSIPSTILQNARYLLCTLQYDQESPATQAVTSVRANSSSLASVIAVTPNPAPGNIANASIVVQIDLFFDPVARSFQYETTGPAGGTNCYLNFNLIAIGFGF